MPRLGLFELGASRALSHLFELTRRVDALAAQRLQSLRCGPSCLGLLPAPFAEPCQLAFDDRQPVLDEPRQPAGVQRQLVEAQATLLGLGPLRRVAGEPLVDVGEPARQLNPPRLVLRRLHLEVAPHGGHRVTSLLQPAARRPDALDATRAVHLVRAECGQRLLQLGNASGLALEPLGQLGLMGCHRGRLDRGVTPFAVDLLQLGGERAEPAVVGVERPTGLRLLFGRALQLDLGRGEPAFRGLQRAWPRRRERVRASSRAARVAPRPDAPTRLAAALNRSPSGVTATAPG